MAVLSCQKEGIIICGEERLSAWAKPILEEAGLYQKVAELQMTSPPLLNHFSSRREKIELLQLLHQTALPPLPCKFSELNNYDAIRMQFSEMLKIDTAGTKFKYGTEIPNVITEWLEEDFHEAFLLIKGQNYDKELKNKITILGFKTVAMFYKSLIQKCYAYRLGGEHHMDTFHTDLSLEVVKELLEDKEDMTAAENMFENHPRIEDEEQERDIRQRRDISLRRELEQRRSAGSSTGGRSNNLSRSKSVSRSRSRSRSRSSSRNRSRNTTLSPAKEWPKMLSPGILQSMHENGVVEENGRPKCVQLLAKKEKEGKVMSATMGDGCAISQNVFTADEEMARAWMDWPIYCMVMLEQVSVHKDKLVIVEAKATTDKVASQPLASDGVKELEVLHPAALTFWGIKFPEEVRVNMSYIPVTADLNSTLISADPGLTEVSTRPGHVRTVTSHLVGQKPPVKTSLFGGSGSISPIRNKNRKSDPKGVSGTSKSSYSQGGASKSAYSQGGGSKSSHSQDRGSKSSHSQDRGSKSPYSQGGSSKSAYSQGGASKSAYSQDTDSKSPYSQEDGGSKSNLSQPSSSKTPDSQPGDSKDISYPAGGSSLSVPTLIDRMGTNRLKCSLCSGHKTFRNETVFHAHMYNHHSTKE